VRNSKSFHHLPHIAILSDQYRLVRFCCNRNQIIGRTSRNAVTQKNHVVPSRREHFTNGVWNTLVKKELQLLPHQLCCFAKTDCRQDILLGESWVFLHDLNRRISRIMKLLDVANRDAGSSNYWSIASDCHLPHNFAIQF
jgi:hypothetical protein